MSILQYRVSAAAASSFHSTTYLEQCIPELLHSIRHWKAWVLQNGVPLTSKVVDGLLHGGGMRTRCRQSYVGVSCLHFYAILCLLQTSYHIVDAVELCMAL